MPQISVIVPVYKAERTIEKCINSILDQTFTDFELILVDDGSPDRSGIICDEMAKKDKRIIVIHKENGGVSSARNVGLEIAKGKYLMFCDSDDYVSPEWCEWLYNAMENGNVHMAVCGIETFYNDGRKEYRGVGSYKAVTQVRFLEMAANVSLYISCNKIFKAEIVRKSNLRFDERISRCEDVLFVLAYLQLSNKGDCFCYGSPALYHYVRCSEDSLSRRYVEGCWNIEQKRLAQTLELMKKYEIPEKEYISFYSEKVALSVSDAVANVFRAKKCCFLRKYRALKSIVFSTEYGVAIECGGMEKTAGGVFLKLLKMRSPFLIYVYCTLSRLKIKIVKRERF